MTSQLTVFSLSIHQSTHCNTYLNPSWWTEKEHTICQQPPDIYDSILMLTAVELSWLKKIDRSFFEGKWFPLILNNHWNTGVFLYYLFSLFILSLASQTRGSQGSLQKPAQCLLWVGIRIESDCAVHFFQYNHVRTRLTFELLFSRIFCLSFLLKNWL